MSDKPIQASPAMLSAVRGLFASSFKDVSVLIPIMVPISVLGYWGGPAFWEGVIILLIMSTLALFRFLSTSSKTRVANCRVRRDNTNDASVQEDMIHRVWEMLGVDPREYADPAMILQDLSVQQRLNNWFCHLESNSNGANREELMLLPYLVLFVARRRRTALLGRVFLCMMRCGVRGPRSMYREVISILAIRGRLAGAKIMYHRMRNMGYEGDTHLYTTLIHSAGKAVNFQEVESWYNEMVESGFPPTDVTLNSLVYAYGKCGKPELAEQSLELMRSMGLTASVVTFNSVILGYARAGQTERAEFWIAEMTRRSVTPDGVSYATILHTLGKSHTGARACQAHRLLWRMRECGLGRTKEMCEC